MKINSRKLPWKREVMAYSVEAALKQFVTLPAQPKPARKPFYAPTWYENIIGAATPKDFAEIRDGVNQIMEKLIRRIRLQIQNHRAFYPKNLSEHPKD